MTRNLGPQHPRLEVYTFDLGNIFREAVWLGQALGNSPPAFDPDVQAGLERLFRALNPWGLWFGVETQFDDNTTGPGIFQAADHSPDTPPAARNAIKTLATALVCLNSGEGHHQRGRELLRSGVWLLWHRLSPHEQERSQQFLSDAVRLWEIPTDEAGKPLRHDGPLVRSENDIGGSMSPHLWRFLNGREFQEQTARSHQALDMQFRQIETGLARLPVDAPVGIPSPLAEAYHHAAVALREATRFVNRSHRYRVGIERHDAAIGHYRETLEALRQLVSQADTAFLDVEGALRSWGQPVAFIRVLGGLKLLLERARLEQIELLSEPDQLNAALTRLYFFPASRPFGDDSLNLMRDEVARATLALGGKPPPRFVVSVDERAVYLDDDTKPFAENLDPDVVAYLQAIAKAHPDPITFDAICETTKSMKGKNQDRLRKKLPELLVGMVIADRVGHYLKLPPRR